MGVTALLHRVQLTDWRGSLDGRPTLWSRNLFDGFGWRVSLHRMVGADDIGCFHTHPAWALRIILAGGYVEQLEDGTERLWTRGQAGFVRPSLSHRISGLLNGEFSYSLWIRAPKSARIEQRGDGWPKTTPTPAAGRRG